VRNFGIGADLEPVYESLSGWSPFTEGDLKEIVADEFSGCAPMSIDGLVRHGIWMGALFRDSNFKINVNPLLKSIFDQNKK
jgi:hypothetical protein